MSSLDRESVHSKLGTGVLAIGDINSDATATSQSKSTLDICEGGGPQVQNLSTPLRNAPQSKDTLEPAVGGSKVQNLGTPLRNAHLSRAERLNKFQTMSEYATFPKFHGVLNDSGTESDDESAVTDAISDTLRILFFCSSGVGEVSNQIFYIFCSGNDLASRSQPSAAPKFGDTSPTTPPLCWVGLLLCCVGFLLWCAASVFCYVASGFCYVASVFCYVP